MNGIQSDYFKTVDLNNGAINDSVSVNASDLRQYAAQARAGITAAVAQPQSN